MEFSTIRQILSYAAENFGFKILESETFDRYVTQALDESGKWHRRRCPLTAPLMMWFVFAMMLYRSLSLSNLVKMLIQRFRQVEPKLSLRAITSEAACHARTRLGAEPLQLFFERLARSIQPASLFHGHRMFSTDGVKFNIPDTADNEAHFGRQGNCRGRVAYPQIRVVCMVEASTRQVRGVDVDRYDVAEHTGVVKLLDTLEKDDLLLLDRGLSATWLFAMCQERSVRFLGRIHPGWKPQVLKRLGPGDSLVRVCAAVPEKHRSAVGRTKDDLTLRMLEYRIDDGQPIRLLTDLLDPVKYPAYEVASLYHTRWECELAFDEVKNHQGSPAGGSQDILFRSKTAAGVLQECYALFSLYSMIRGLMAQAGRVHGVNPLELSFVDVVQVIKDTSPCFQRAKTRQQRCVVYDQLLRDIADCHNPRSRRKRWYPRAVKRVKNKYGVRKKTYSQTVFESEPTLQMVG